MRIFAENFRGFKSVNIDLSKFTLILGDNSSGKSSLLYLIEAVCNNDLNAAPRFNEEFGVSEYDYFSPYFDNSDVTFGFCTPTFDFSKIITVKMNKFSRPVITRCSYLADNNFVSIRQRGKNVQYRVIRDVDPHSIENFISLHNRADGYKRGSWDDDLSIGDPSVLFFVADKKNSVPRDIAHSVYKNILRGARLVSPIRALPRRLYSHSRKINPQSLHFATLLMDMYRIHEDDHIASVNRFGQESGLFDSIRVQRVSSSVGDSPLIVFVKKNAREFSLNQVGIGVSQVVPVLMESVFSQVIEPSYVLVQQPELHLHPIAQAALGTYFYNAASHGLRAVLETHSSYLIDRIRAEIRDNSNNNSDEFKNDSLSASDFSILFCRNTPEGNIIDEVVIGNDGSLIGEPDQFHQFFVDEMLRTMF